MRNLFLVYFICFLLGCSLLGCGNDPEKGDTGPQGEPGAQGQSGTEGAQGPEGSHATVYVYDFENGDCKLIEGVHVKRVTTTLRIHGPSDFSCVQGIITTLDDDDEIYWVNATTKFEINTSDRLFVLKY